jgi:hypothetical protein
MSEPAKRFDEQKFKKEAKHLFGVSDAQISPEVARFIENSDDPFSDLVVKKAVQVVEAPAEQPRHTRQKAKRSHRKFFGGIVKEAL